MNKEDSPLLPALSWPLAELSGPANTHAVTDFTDTPGQTGQNGLSGGGFGIENRAVKKHTIYHKIAGLGEQAGKLKWVYRSVHL